MRRARHRPSRRSHAEGLFLDLPDTSLRTAPGRSRRAGCSEGSRAPHRAHQDGVTVVQHHTRQVEVEAVRWPSATSDWMTAIRDLTRRVETGRVCDRDLEDLAGGVGQEPLILHGCANRPRAVGTIAGARAT